ncbi:hypothetical protein DLJ54_00315 [Corynebacterium heidelbergense]|uniref:Uncharacterized protein n=1 Tax=Corynebacterium heidelbergense TaxID=2055947 RepID=A0A364V8W4_9CORY|nr:hypothetical protein DLJ54_00315 [Corynebacterium heidelbergense]
MEALRQRYEVLFSSEQAYDRGQIQPFFDRMFSLIADSDDTVTQDDKAQFGSYCFVSIVNVPTGASSEVGEHLRILGIMLRIDFESVNEDMGPRRFPCETRAIRISHTGYEIEGCSSH